MSQVQINLLLDIVTHRWREQQDFFAGGNMFIYNSLQQASRDAWRFVEAHRL